MDLLQAGSVAESGSGPVESRLEVNYPNPFNPQTRIRYYLPERQTVELTVFDLQGRCVKTLVNGVRESGRHELVFDGTGFASGLYFYQLKAQDRNMTRSMLLLK